MAYIITEPCIGTKDTSCVDVCPVEAIYADSDIPEKWKNYIEINAEWYKK